MDGIAFGCLAALAVVRLPAVRAAQRAARCVGGAAVILIMVLRDWTMALGLVRYGLNVSVLQLGVALLLFGMSAPHASRLCDWAAAPLRAIGRASYEIYLSHMFVVLAGTRLFAWLGLERRFLGVGYVLALLGSIGLGSAVARLYSSPLNHLVRARWLRALPGRG